MSSASSPCAACKMQRRKCTQDCVFAPYFPPDQPQKFANIHKVFGASNVSKLLNELNAGQREDAVNSLAYEAEYRLRDPVYGCVGLISVLQQKLKQVQRDLNAAKRELASYIGPTALAPLFPAGGFVQNNNPNHPSSSGIPYSNFQQQLIIQDPHPPPPPPPQQQQFLEPHHLMVMGEPAAEMFRAYEQQQMQQLDLMSFNNIGFEPLNGGGPVTATGYHQASPAPPPPPSLGLGAYHDNTCYPVQQNQLNPHDHDQIIQLQPHHLMLQQEQPPPPPPPQQQSQPQLQLETKSEEEAGRHSC
ncbi:hypothetical protein DM860_005007 [Cuscuta australis]|uniref:LOB domain-containing protein n=1 Tax=Cuscuta australis TaxID=267555 RepID=A0A328DPY2_9ASTE|nr:hypothetical protein DM860_005007 [Cuscuta australis]